MRVVLESPFAGDVKQNIEYARECMADSLKRGESPFASHLLYTQVLEDSIPEEREQGMSAAFEWAKFAKKTVVYTDLGISTEMQEGIDMALNCEMKIEYRKIKKK